MNFGKIPLIYREISSRGSNPSKALHTCLTDMCANTHLYSPHFLTCRLVLQSKNIFPSVSPMVPLTKKSIRAKTCPLIQSSLWHQKNNSILNTYLVIAKNVISENFPSFAGKFPHGVLIWKATTTHPSGHVYQISASYYYSFIPKSVWRTDRHFIFKSVWRTDIYF